MNQRVKVLVSLALVFHLFAIFVFPNPESILSRKTSWFLFPYGNFLGINTTWRFFSPDPHVSKLQIQAYAYDSNGDVSFEEQVFFPNTVEEAGSRESFNRLMNFAVLASSKEKHYEGILKHYFCGQYPQADELSFSHVEYVLPSIERARLEGGNFESLVKEKRTPMPTVSCKVGGFK